MRWRPGVPAAAAAAAWARPRAALRLDLIALSGVHTSGSRAGRSSSPAEWVVPVMLAKRCLVSVKSLCSNRLEARKSHHHHHHHHHLLAASLSSQIRQQKER
ncbi:hypothetical protein E2C01_048353 [Portunus trituberculatus]|uniref:Uncharacterized protein n=1 Tax=Portunus trituberculatus TaxID=210409 RepID=A0A5B7GAH5_PORTR|nr:hypothetical protein [Portunus trituberculatus]